MHPVLKSVLEPLAEQVAIVSKEEAQIAPLPGAGRWCAQQIMEHLLLTYEQTTAAVNRHLKSGRPPKHGRSLLESFVRLQTIGFGYMPEGIPAIQMFRPEEYAPEDGPTIATRFLCVAEEMDHRLGLARKKFGIQACGEHPFFGALRVDEWRRYHAVHARHHQAQLKVTIRYAKAQTASSAQAVKADRVTSGS